MISRFRYFGFLLRTSICLLPFFAFGATAYLWFRTVGTLQFRAPDADHYWILFAFTELVWIIIAYYSGLSEVTNLSREFTAIKAVALTCLPTLLFQTALLGVVKELNLSRLFILVTDGTLFIGALAIRNFFRLTSKSAIWAPKHQNIIVVGTDQYANRGVKLLHRVPFFQCKVRAYLQLPGQPVVVSDAPVIDASNMAWIEQLEFDEIVIAIPPHRYLQIAALLEGLQNLGKPLRAVLDFGNRLVVREKLIHFGRLQLMDLALSPVESAAYTIGKRTVDLLGAAAGLIALSPVMAIIAILVKLSSRGPVFFRQQRVGRNGRLFTLLKFRTMHCSSTRDSDTIWTTKHDSRCTRLGFVLRRFSLDELPQLLNVVRGEMSLVGPRPERPHFVAKFRQDLQRYNLRHSCQVGMTGLAQVNGFRGDTSISDRLRYDLYYIHNWSLGLDFRIMLRTISTALKGDNLC